jgi:hypothetical protein
VGAACSSVFMCMQGTVLLPPNLVQAHGALRLPFPLYAQPAPARAPPRQTTRLLPRHRPPCPPPILPASWPMPTSCTLLTCLMEPRPKGLRAGRPAQLCISEQQPVTDSSRPPHRHKRTCSVTSSNNQYLALVLMPAAVCGPGQPWRPQADHPAGQWFNFSAA